MQPCQHEPASSQANKFPLRAKAGKSDNRRTVVQETIGQKCLGLTLNVEMWLAVVQWDLSKAVAHKRKEREAAECFWIWWRIVNITSRMTYHKILCTKVCEAQFCYFLRKYTIALMWKQWGNAGKANPGFSASVISLAKSLYPLNLFCFVCMHVYANMPIKQDILTHPVNIQA